MHPPALGDAQAKRLLGGFCLGYVEVGSQMCIKAGGLLKLLDTFRKCQKIQNNLSSAKHLHPF
jgi:hypothetical protein